MTPQEKLNVTFPELFAQCTDVKSFTRVATILINFGIKIGKNQVLTDYNKLFRGEQ